jgi:isopropylmalate/homocitrate/citramalate synthase
MKHKTDMYWVTDFNYMEEIIRMFPDMPKKVSIYDNTLREGDQTPGCVMRTDEKLALAKGLDELGVDFIELFPAVSKDDEAALTELSKPGVLKHARTSALVRPGTIDLDLAHKCGCKHAFVEGPGNMYIAEAMVGISDENAYIERFTSSVRKARELGIDVTACPWDIGKAPISLLERWVKELVAAGANDICYGDTWGFTLPWTVQYLVKKMKEWAGPDVILSCHFHNDYGLATANTLAAVSAGASCVQVAMNSLGERAGNASLDEVAVNLALNMGVDTGIALNKLYLLSQQLAKITRMPLPRTKPILGDASFSMGSGIMVDVIKKIESRGESIANIFPFDPALVGRPPYNILWGKGVGSSMVNDKVKKMGLSATKEQLSKITQAIKAEALLTKSLLSETEVENLIKGII